MDHYGLWALINKERATEHRRILGLINDIPRIIPTAMLRESRLGKDVYSPMEAAICFVTSRVADNLTKYILFQDEFKFMYGRPDYLILSPRDVLKIDIKGDKNV